MHGVQDAATRAGALNRRTSTSPTPPPRPNALATVAGHGDYVKCLTYAEQGSVLVSGGLDKRILLWDLQRMSAPLMVLRGGSGAAEGGSDGGWGGGGGSASNSAMVNPTGYSPAAAGRQQGRGQQQGAGAPWLSDEGEGGWPHLRDPLRVALRAGQAAAGPNEVLELCRQNKGSVHCVAAATDASLVASGGTDRMIRLLDPRAGGGQAAKVCKLDGHGDNVRCVKIDEGGTRVVSGSSDGTIRVWDVRQQCCLGVYELPGGSVWAMQPSPCDLDVYYSGGRGRRVYRTDFRTGESSLVCMTDSEVLDIELELGRGGGTDSTGPYEQPMSMWLSSTQPHIALWGGEASGGGLALRSGRPAAAAGAADMAVADGVGDRAAEEDDMEVDVFDVTPAFAEDPAEGGGEAGGVGGEGGGCLLDAPVGLIRGQPGVVRHKVLNNRRHVLTEDDARPLPNVALWDVTKARQVEAYPRGTVLEDKERSLLEIIAVRPWFTVDTHLGTPLVSLTESNVFDGELYAVDARGERQTLLASPPPSPSPSPSPAAAAAAVGGTNGVVATAEAAAEPEFSRQPAPSSSSSLSSTLPSASQGKGGTAAVAKTAEGGAADGSVESGGGATAAAPKGVAAAGAEPGPGPRPGPGAAVRAPKGRSVQDEVKVNLGDAALRGLFSRWVDQHLRLHGDGGGGGGGGGGALASS
ncbi:unnamed protein product, partial [Ectocarpus fasciculatus]